MNQLKQVQDAVKFLNKKTKNFKPEILLITGSGMAGSIPELEKKIVIPYSVIPHFLHSTIPGHPGNLIFGTYKGKNIIILHGRFHYYEGYDMKDLALSIRTAAFLGAKTMIVSGAVGSLNLKLPVGSLCILKDHVNFMAHNPLIGNYDPAFGRRFIDLTDLYDKKLRKDALQIAKKLKIKAGEGVYAALTGPNFETPSEIRMLKILKVDVVGMSTVPEVLCARQLGMKICGLTWVVNMGCGISKTPISHEDTIKETKKIEGSFKRVLERLIPLC